MVKFKLTNKAVEDLGLIWNYSVDNWSEQQAKKYYEFLIESCQKIANNPDLGKNYEEIRTEIFGFKTNRHIIFYRKIIDEPIEIIRILHERMDLKSKI